MNDKRWSDGFDPDDGYRVLICRIRPRGISKKNETWHVWEQDLAPSRPLLKAYLAGEVPWPEYEQRFLAEMKGAAAQAALDRLVELLKKKPVTLLCASACTDRTHCHRSLVRALLEAR